MFRDTLATENVAAVQTDIKLSKEIRAREAKAQRTQMEQQSENGRYHKGLRFP